MSTPAPSSPCRSSPHRCSPCRVAPVGSGREARRGGTGRARSRPPMPSRRTWTATSAPRATGRAAPGRCSRPAPTTSAVRSGCPTRKKPAAARHRHRRRARDRRHDRHRAVAPGQACTGSTCLAATSHTPTNHPTTTPPSTSPPTTPPPSTPATPSTGPFVGGSPTLADVMPADIDVDEDCNSNGTPFLDHLSGYYVCTESDGSDDGRHDRLGLRVRHEERLPGRHRAVQQQGQVLRRRAPASTCPPATAVDGYESWYRDGNDDSALGHIECYYSGDHKNKDYAWTDDAERTIIVAEATSSQTFSQLDSWWTHNNTNEAALGPPWPTPSSTRASGTSRPPPSCPAAASPSVRCTSSSPRTPPGR